MSDIVSTGRFRLDRRRALDKLEQFRFEDPRRYVLELLAAAVCAGATAVELVNDSDDLVIRWEGTPLTGDELDTVFDPLFGQPTDARGAFRQHVAIGVLGALGLRPRWIRLDTGDGERALRLEVDDPTRTAHAPLAEALSGVRIHVRERMGPAVMLEALLLAVRPPAETELLRGTLHRYPLPLRVNGEPFAVAPEPPAWVLHWEGRVDGRAVALWLVAGTGHVDVVRNGIVVGRLEEDLGGFGVAGWIAADDVRLNASRSRIVEDPAWQAVREAFARAVRSLLAHGPSALDGPDLAETVRWTDAGPLRATREALLARVAPAALSRLAPDLGWWARVPCLVDLRGVAWSAAGLRAGGATPCVSRCEQDVPGWTRPTFGVHLRPLLQKLGFAANDETALHTAHAEGARRRAALAARRQAPDLPDPARRFDVDGTRGAVRLRDRGPLRLRVQLDGVVVETIEMPTPTRPLDAVVDRADFATDPGFRHVVRDAVFSAAMRLVLDQGEALAVDAIAADLAAGRIGDALARTTDGLGWRTKDEPMAPDLSRPSLGPWTGFPVLPTGDGGAVSALEAVRRDPGHWKLVDAAVTGVPPEALADVLVIPAERVATWRRLLGASAVDGRAAVAARQALHARLARPRRQPRVEGAAWHRHAFDGDGPTGELVLGRGGDPSVDVLRDGVFVTTLGIARDLPGLAGVVDVPEAKVTTAHDALLPDDEAALRRRLGREIDALLRGAWGALGPDDMPPPALLRWLAGSKLDGLRPVLAGRRLATRVDGTPLRVDWLWERAAKSGEKLDVVSAVPDVPGFDGAIVANADVEAVLQAHAPRRWRDADGAVLRATEARRLFLVKRPWTGPRAVARSSVSGDGWTAEVRLPEDVADPGRRTVIALYADRALEPADGTVALGATIVARGPAIAPTPGFDRVADRAVVAELRRVATAALPGLVRDALASRSGSAHADFWRALLLRALTLDRGGPVAEILLQVPLLTRDDGRPLTGAEVRARAGAVHGVSPTVAAEPGADELRVRLEPKVAELLVALRGAPVPDATAGVLARQEGARQRASAPRRAARIAEPCGVRRVLDTADLRGEIGLLPDGTGLSVDYVVDGRLLGTATIACPVRAIAAVEGPAIRADDRFRSAIDDARLAAAHGALRSAVLQLAREHAATVRGDPPWTTFCLQLALAGGAERAWPLLQRLDGTRASVADLEAEVAAHGALGVVTAGDAATFRLRPSPLRIDLAQRAALAARFSLVDLTGRAALARDPEDAAGLGTVAIGGGWVAARPGGTVRVRAGALEPDRWDARALGSPIPLDGWIDDPDLAAGPLGAGVVEVVPGALERARARLAAAGRQILGRLASRPAAAPGGRALLADVFPTARELAAGLAEGHPLLQVPLLPDGDGGLHPVAAAVAVRPVRFVDLRALTGTGPRADVLAPDVPTRTWLAAVVEVADVTGEVRDREDGIARRRAAPAPPAPPAGVAIEPAGEGGAVWLTARRAAGRVAIVVDGKVVEERPVPVPGAGGVLAGPFATDARFERATVPRQAWSGVLDALGRLLSREWASGHALRYDRLPDGWRGRLARVALEPPWPEVTLALRGDGRPFTLGEAQQAARKRKTVKAYGPGEPVVDQAIALPPGDVDGLRALLAPAPLVRVAPAPDEAAPASAADPRALHRAVRRLLPHDVPDDAIAAVVTARAGLTEPGDRLGVYLLAARVLHRLGRAGDEVALVGAVVAQWPAAGGDPG